MQKQVRPMKQVLHKIENNMDVQVRSESKEDGSAEWLDAAIFYDCGSGSWKNLFR